MSILRKLADFWCLFGVNLIQDENLNIPTGAATFSLLTKYAIENKENIIFIYPCYRPLDLYGNKKIRSDSFLQIQVILCNFNQTCKQHNISPISIAYKSISSIVGDHMFNVIEDNWSSPTMKSFGIGWEYRILGIEVLQITKLNTFIGYDVSNFNIYEYAYGYDRLCNMFNIYSINNINNFTNLNNIFNYYCNQNVFYLETKFMEIINKSEVSYNEFLLLNLIFNILDTKGLYNIYTKNLYMKIISNRIKNLKYEY